MSEMNTNCGCDTTDDASNRKKVPTGSFEDVEFSEELADADDMEAQARAAAADYRADQFSGE
ncbi:MAG: YfhD family protein [Candidatus Cohnella colombiensis]|uniref:YfhD family protein n=1 Tax=Candidatus Cohnella colombiensis TaxID=3121368 RepID=A0AA95F1P0_9BACL|nr:MAG: YfhD family protein [Cohnella sp.]